MLNCIVLVLVSWLIGCSRSTQPISGIASYPDTQVALQNSNGAWTAADQVSYQKQKDEALKRAHEARSKPQQGNALLLPNFEPGPGRPLPLHRNFYSLHPHYRAYLLCTFDVEDASYRKDTEGEWFREALAQVRSSGASSFPKVDWVAVCIFNRADGNTTESFGNGFRGGAVFSARNIFDTNVALSAMVSSAAIDRNPFTNDISLSTPRERQRWLIVERHVATNHASPSTNQP
jgi:hypothetical protein